MRFALALALLLCPISSHAASWFISTAGSDAHGCTNSGADACLTLNRGIAVAAAGDTVTVSVGTYSGTQTVNQTKTSPGVTVKCAVAQSVTPDSCKLASGGSLNLLGAWYTLQDLTVDVGDTCHGCVWENQASHVKFLNFNLHGAFAGVFWDTGPSVSNITDVTWDGGELLSAGRSGNRTCNGNGGIADNLAMWIATFNSGTISNLVIRKIKYFPAFVDASVLCGSPADPLHLERLRIDGAITTMLFEKNIMLDGGNENTGTIFQTSFTGGPPSGLIFRNNYISGGGTALWQDAQGACAGTWEYNTFGPNATFAFTSCSGAGQVYIGNTGAWPSSQGCVGTQTKNVWQSASNWSCGTNTVVIGTDFTNTALGLGGAFGYTVQPGSPLINAGESTCASTANGEDIEGHTRPISTSCDAGAFEFGSSVAATMSTTFSGLVQGGALIK